MDDRGYIVIDADTGEAVQGVKRIILEDDANRSKEQISKRVERNFQFYDYGNFYFLLYDYKFFDDLIGADLIRLLYLASFMPYSDNGYAIKRNGDFIKKNECAALLNLSKTPFYNFWNTCESLGYLYEGDNGEVILSNQLFYKGKVGMKMVKQSSELTRININTIKYLYHQKDINHKKLSYLYRLIPYTDTQHNIVCKGFYEASGSPEDLPTVSDLCDMLGYQKNNFNRLKDYLLDIKMRSGERAVSIFQTKTNRYEITINPKIFYGGDCYKGILEDKFYDKGAPPSHRQWR